MSTMNLNPKNLIILGVLGVGAYWFLTRRPRAQTVTPAAVGRATSAGGGTNPPRTGSVAQGLLAGVQQYLQGVQTPRIYVPPSAADALPVNPPTGYLPDADAWARDENGQGLF